mmetsp:Transcript_6267/g.9958  ORF Transcript_6267/g.9958 Transcript_6267/m.9958 type:complete len:233 (-) Transcript_6267:493-1191(-)
MRTILSLAKRIIGMPLSGGMLCSLHLIYLGTQQSVTFPRHSRVKKSTTASQAAGNTLWDQPSTPGWRKPWKRAMQTTSLFSSTTSPCRGAVRTTSPSSSGAATPGTRTHQGRSGPGSSISCARGGPSPSTSCWWRMTWTWFFMDTTTCGLSSRRRRRASFTRRCPSPTSTPGTTAWPTATRARTLTACPPPGTSRWTSLRRVSGWSTSGRPWTPRRWSGSWRRAGTSCAATR